MTTDANQPNLPSQPPPEFTAIGVAKRGPGRRRTAAAALAIAVGVAAIVAKPWAAAGPPSGAPSTEAPSLTPQRPPATSEGPDPGRPPPAAIARVMKAHDAWGVRAIVGLATLEERWLAAPLPMPADTSVRIGSSSQGLAFAVEGRPVRLVGLTTPPGITLVDVRLSLVRPLGRTVPITAWEIDVTGSEGLERLLAPAEGGAWTPGVYQFRIKLVDGLTTVTFAII